MLSYRATAQKNAGGGGYGEAAHIEILSMNESHSLSATELAKLRTAEEYKGSSLRAYHRFSHSPSLVEEYSMFPLRVEMVPCVFECLIIFKEVQKKVASSTYHSGALAHSHLRDSALWETNLLLEFVKAPSLLSFAAK